MAFFSLLLAVALGDTIATAEPIEAANYWKVQCRELSTEFRERLPVPYHPYSNKLAIKCTDPTRVLQWEVDKTNLHIVITNLFYHERIDVRERALEMLEKYRCKKEYTCDELARLIDAHIQAAGIKQPTAWTGKFFDRARAVQHRAEKNR